MIKIKPGLFKNNKAFTIVELLVVIVVIGILASITIVSYSGVQNKAIASGLQFDLSNSAKLLKMYQIEYGYYPSTLDSNYCPSSPSVDNRYCLKSMNGTTLEYAGEGQAFELIDKHTVTGIAYRITEGSSVTAYTPGPWKQVSGGNQHTCAVNYNGQAYCWGSNDHGQLGNGTATSSSVPVAVSKGAMPSLNVKKISAGYYHTCAIASDDRAYCWGNGGSGRLGNGGTATENAPVAVNRSGVLNGLTIKSIVTGLAHSCAIASDNLAYCWGDGYYGQLGENGTANEVTPVAVYHSGAFSGLTVKAISAGDYHTCYITSDNNAYCWGYGYYNQIGDGGSSNRSAPTLVNNSGVLSGLTIKSITSGASYNCVIASDNQSYCWGYNASGQLGDNSQINKATPVAVDRAGALNGLTVKSVSAGGESTCAIASDNNPYCWGDGGVGQLGNNSTARNIVPVSVVRTNLPVGISKSISSGRSHTCITYPNDYIYCWGRNNSGQIGDNSTTNRLIPVQIVNP